MGAIIPGMLPPSFRPLVGFVLLLAPIATFAQAQAQTPTPAQAQALLDARPDLANQVRQRIATSGLTPEQVRDRLRAEGYPAGFLDAYLSEGGATPTVVSDQVIVALRRLGISDEDEASVMRTMLREGRGSAPAVAARAPIVRDDRPLGEQADSLAAHLYGLDVFQQSTSEFVPTLAGPVGPDYRLGPGDELVLILTGEVELAHTLAVTREGFIVIPQVGQLAVANLTMAELESLLYARLARSYSGVRRGADARTRFSLSVSRLRAIQVFVTGEVAQPSSYRVSSTATAMTALYAAGGPTANGSMREVVVRRNGAVVGTLDLYDYLLRGDNGRDVRLENGDIVFVPIHGSRVRVTGEVRRPATYELRSGETLRDAIAAAGGLRATAIASRLLVTRIVPPADRAVGGRDRIAIDIPVVSDAGEIPTIAMQPGDEVRVFAVAERIRSRIKVMGHVWTAGEQGFRPGMLLSDALRGAGGLKPDAYLGQVTIARLRADSTRIQLRAVIRDTSGAVVNDLPLAEDDEITVFSLTGFRGDRYVAIGGSVRRGGRYPFREGMTLRDLVLESGGLRDGAHLREAEVARLPERRLDGRTAVTIRVPLDSSYLADYVPGQAYAAAPGDPAAPFGSTPDFVLRPYDNVLIMEQPDWQLPRSVVLTGELRFPGRYTLLSKNERLSDIVRRAGGLSAEAAQEAAYLARARALTSFRADSLGLSDSLGTSREDRRIERARVGVDLARALRRPGSDEDLLLFDEDSLHVPFRRTTIEVIGAVNAPTTVAAESGRNVSDYVRSAGGAALHGDAGRAYVVQPNGKIETRRRVLGFFTLDPEPRPGATVVVPVKATEDRTSERIALVSIIAQTVASLATVYALLR
jgi:polysaccharide biosynthesis/export protein